MRTTALEKQAFAHFVEGFFLGMRLRQVKAQTFGFGRDPGGQSRHIGHLAATKCGFGNFGGIEALQGFHAGHQTRLKVLHLLGVCKVFGQFNEGPLDHAGTFAQVAFFQRSVFRTTDFFPEVFAFGFKKVSRVTVLQHGTVFVDALAGCFLSHDGGGAQGQNRCNGKG